LLTDFRSADQSNSFDDVLWVDVGSRQAAEQGFMNISAVLKLQAQSMQQVVQHLSGTQQTWLLVLDNANDPTTDFHPFFPSGLRGTVIMTSRNPECGQVYGHDHWEKLDILEGSLARDLLLRAAGYEPSPSDCEHADKIVKVLGSHTLAVVLAGSYIARHRNIDKYLHVYEKHWNRIVQHAPKQEQSRYGSVNATFEASVNILEGENSETSRDALQLLHILSTLEASDVPLSLFEEVWSGIGRVPEIDKVNDMDGVSDWHVSRLPRFLESTTSEWDSYRLVEACNTLETLAIITSSGSGHGGKLSMHPLLHDWIWRRQTAHQKEVSWTMTGSAIALASHGNGSWLKRDDKYRSHLESYITMRRKYGLSASPELPVLQIVYCCPGLLDGIRLDRLALLCLDELAQTQFGDGKLFVTQPLVFKKLWARCLHRSRQITRSIRIWEEVMSLEASLAETHPGRLASQHELARAYLTDGQKKKAVALLEHVVRVEKGSPAQNHPHLLASQHELARAYLVCGQVKQATTLLERNIKGRIGDIAEDHPDHLASQYELAQAFQAMGHVPQAIALLEHVVKVEEGSLAESHPHRLTSQRALARAYQVDGQVERAVTLLEHVIKVSTDVLEENNPYRLESQSELARLYRTNGQLEQAIALLEHVVKVNQDSLGGCHPSVQTSMRELDCAYQANKQAGNAVALLEHVIYMQECTVAEDHPSWLASQHELAGAYEANGQVGKAVALLEHVVEVRQGSLAEDPSKPACITTCAFANTS
jgi:tetratricopeptide (TPR) repeat protein